MRCENHSIENCPTCAQGFVFCPTETPQPVSDDLLMLQAKLFCSKCGVEIKGIEFVGGGCICEKCLTVSGRLGG